MVDGFRDPVHLLAAEPAQRDPGKKHQSDCARVEERVIVRERGQYPGHGKTGAKVETALRSGGSHEAEQAGERDQNQQGAQHVGTHFVGHDDSRHGQAVGESGGQCPEFGLHDFACDPSHGENGSDSGGERNGAIDQERAAELHHQFEEQEEKRGVGVDPDILPEVFPGVLLGDENVPVAVVLDVLGRGQHEARNGGEQGDQDQGESESVAFFGNLQSAFLTCGGPGAITYS